MHQSLVFPLSATEAFYPQLSFSLLNSLYVHTLCYQKKISMHKNTSFKHIPWIYPNRTLTNPYAPVNLFSLFPYANCLCFSTRLAACHCYHTSCTKRTGFMESLCLLKVHHMKRYFFEASWHDNNNKKKKHQQNPDK